MQFITPFYWEIADCLLSLDPFISLKREIATLEKLITFQSKILQHGTIPVKHHPESLPLINHPSQTLLNKEFLQDYKTLYLKHLNSVIEANTVTLNLKKARLQSSNKKDYHHQPQPNTPPTQTSSFQPQPNTPPIKNNSLQTQHDTLPITQANSRYEAVKDASSLRILPQKRKLPPSTVPRKRQTTMDAFLGKGNPKPPNIT